MRNLIIFIRRYSNFLFFLFLEIICLGMVVKNNNLQGTAWLNSTNKISSRLFTQFNNLQYYFQLKATNERLVKQNQRLLNLLPSSFDAMDTLQKIVADTALHQKFLYRQAKVVNNSVNNLTNYITIHRGSNQGVQPNMGVISTDGVVGIVRSVSPHYAVVMSLLNKETRISARLKSGESGTVSWDGENAAFALLKGIPKTSSIHLGDTVWTSGYSTLFPAGIPIGYISQFSEKSTSNFYVIRIRLATHFYTLQYVYVIEDLMGDEQKNLESTETKE
ncbi:MAG: rod shape-determining protein MreC [Chitinophagaceae bacterium]